MREPCTLNPMSDAECYDDYESVEEYYSTKSEEGMQDSECSDSCESAGEYYSTESDEDIRIRHRPHFASNGVAKKRKKSSELSMDGVYVIEDGNGRVYVGKSNHIDRRIAEHMRGHGTEFLDKRSITRIMNLAEGSQQDLESWERAETLAQMYRKGVNNVRGWMFTSSTLSDVQQQEAFRQICEKFDLCRKCGHNNHFADKCFARKKAFWVTRV